MSNFRSVEFWKSAIMTLPDAAFFELLRTVFGKIKTPFNKQVLLGDLEKFLLRMRETIAAYISQNDARIIAAVAALNEPVPEALETFFAGELSYAELHDRVINLEERFIIYRFLDSGRDPRQGVSRLALNPVLEPILVPFIKDKSLLFPSVPVATNEIPPDAATICNSRILAALLSFVSQNREFFTGEGRGIRRKIMNTAKTIFPGLPLELFIGGMQVLGLFLVKDSQLLIPDYNRFAAFGSLSSQEQMAYCAAGIWCYCDNQPETFSPWLSRTKIRNYAAFISQFHNALDSKRLYSHETLRKLAYSMKCNDGHEDNRIIEIMEKTGLLVPVDTYWRKVDFESAPSSECARIAMDTPFTFVMYPEIAYNDAIGLAAFSGVIEAGSTVRFAISRDSAVAAFNRGLSAETIIELLQRLSQNRIDENLIYSLRDWEKRHGEVMVRRGLVLTLAPEQRHLAQTKPLAKLITETLAPGVYVLPETAEEKAIEILHKAGVAIIAQRTAPGASGDDEASGRSTFHFFTPLPAPQCGVAAPPLPISHPNAALPHSPSTLIEGFHSILNQMRLGGEERTELAARIDRRLVLCESQLKDALVRYEKLEARGLDYVGKAMIAKQAVSMQAPVEIMCSGRECLFGIPKALEKADGESILVIDLLDGGNAHIENTPRISNMRRIPLGKISVLRRIKKSIFEH
ncbi:MAG: helicase-associated domain-containing protein [Treponema sp.]|nr:helicase-associated domain-containing protein [Treponema sp.]